MTKIRILIGLLIMMLIINVFLVVAFIKQNHKPPHHKGPRNEIIGKLHLNESQIKLYDVLIKKHRTEVKNSQNHIATLKQNLYSQLKRNSNKTNQDSIIQLIGQKQIELENIHMSHFSAIQSICTEDQQKYFDQLSSEIAHLFSAHPIDKKR